ncbi:MAG TPA: NUDIX domain-containing protein [Acidimicrobiales bacterium]
MSEHLEEVPCASVIVIHNTRLLLVLRANEPGAGRWALPGGKLRTDESAAAGAKRELFEETGLRGVIGDRIGHNTVVVPPRRYEITTYEATTVEGDLRAGSDAQSVEYFDRAGLELLTLSEGLSDWLDRHGIIERLY